MYKLMKATNYGGPDSVDIVWEDEDGFEFICDCGDWDNEQAQKTAALILRLLISNAEV